MKAMLAYNTTFKSPNPDDEGGNDGSTVNPDGGGKGGELGG
jgi:hypothetical protein